MSNRTVFDLISDRAADAPGAVAIHALGRRPLTYAMLSREIRDGVARLNQMGVGRNDRVAVVMPNGPEMAVACLTVCSGATCAPLNPDYKASEFEYFFETLDTRLLIVDADSKTPASGVAEALGIPVIELRTSDFLEAGRFEIRPLAEELPQRGASEAGFAGAGDIALVLHTSGSTSLPKIVPLTHMNLVASALNVASSVALSGEDCCLNMMPLFHVGGLVDTLIAPLATGGSVISATDMSSRTFFECCREFRPTWYQGVPTMLQDIVRRIELDRLSVDDIHLRFARSVSAPLPGRVMEDFERLFDVPVIEIYGMTETAGVITSNPLPPEPRKPGSVGIAAGPEVTVIDEAGNPARTGEFGEVAVRGVNVISGYEGMSEVEPDSFIGSWLRTGDEGYLDDDGYLFLTGRIKEIINRGGEKISPSEIDEIALEHPQIAEAACFAVPHESLGEEVAIAVVEARENGSAADPLTDQAVIEFLAERLAYFKVPRAVFFVEALPRTPGGKLKRHLLAHELAGADGPVREVEWVAPESSTAVSLAAMWERALGVSPIGMHDNFFDLGGDSLKAASFIAELLESSEHSVQVSSLFDAPTIAEFESQLEQARRGEGLAVGSDQGELETGLPDRFRRDLAGVLAGWQGKRARPESLIVGQNTLGSRQPLYWCINGFSAFKRMCNQLGPDQPTYGMRSLRGFDWKSDANVITVASHYVSEILEVQPKGPFLIGGFCDGGKVAFEIALQLRALGHEITLLCLQEIVVAKPYAGRVALFLCAKDQAGRRSPYQIYHQPELGMATFYSGEVSVQLAHWGHTQYYGDQNIGSFARQLEEEIAHAKAPQASREAHRTALALSAGKTQILPDEAYRAEISSRVPLQLDPGESRTISVRVTNRSPITWLPSDASGLFVRNRWRNRSDKKVQIWLDGSAPLAAALAPGESSSIDLTIRAPSDPGYWLLYLDLADEGVAWFREKGSPRARCGVVIGRWRRWARLFKRQLRSRRPD